VSLLSVAVVSTFLLRRGPGTFASMPVRILLFCALATPACKKAATEPASGSAVANPAPPSDDSSPAWTAASHPVALACGDAALPLPPPQPATKPAVDQQLRPGTAIVDCHDQASVDAVCSCLAKSITTWGRPFLLSGPAECVVQPRAQPNAAIVKLTDDPTDTSTKTGGSALVMVAKRGGSWSPLSVVATQGDIDLTATPKLTAALELVSFDAHPGSLYSIEARDETRQSDMGDHAIDGGVTATLCSTTTGTCYEPLKLGTWSYTWTPKEAACQISTLSVFAATFDATGVTMRLEHGSDGDGLTGRHLL